MPGRNIHLPWSVPTLPAWVPWIPGAVFLASTVLKPLKPQYLCGPDPWEGINVLSWPLEFYMAAALLWPRPRGPDGIARMAEERRRADHRRWAAMVGLFFVAGAVALLGFVRIFGPGMNLKAAGMACGCFGPVELPLGVHMAILAVLFPCLAAVFLHEETRLTVSPAVPVAPVPATTPP